MQYQHTKTRAFLSSVICSAMGLALACGVLSSVPARAEEPLTPAQSCDALAAAFDIVAAQSKGTNLDRAKALSVQGVGDCKNNKHQEGINKLHEALFIITKH
ncbi:MAG TPA: hypothetical protein VLV76_13115 [Candidatus Acidoferrum sp.]|nr:hypothetical protein [Candidatus Acidoferrum sp.]